jgi:hypothetical protein
MDERCNVILHRMHYSWRLKLFMYSLSVVNVVVIVTHLMQIVNFRVYTQNIVVYTCIFVRLHIHIQGVSKPMSQTFPGYSPPPLKQKFPINMGPKVNKYRLTCMCWYPFEYYIRCSKCWPFAATHPLRRRIMDPLTRSSWPGRFLMASNVAAMRSHNSSTLVTGVE